MKQSFTIQLLVDEKVTETDFGPAPFSYAELHNILSNAGFEVELVSSPGCKSGIVFYMKRKDAEGN